MQVTPLPKNSVCPSQNSTSASTPHSYVASLTSLYRAFGDVLHFLTKMAHRPFLKRYLKRDEILFSIASCDASLNDALGLFGVGFLFHRNCEMFEFELFCIGSSLFRYARSKQSKRMN
jgi:hypothetical protein